jgi:cytochrome b subunit of formate dehydrogenase
MKWLLIGVMALFGVHGDVVPALLARAPRGAGARAAPEGREGMTGEAPVGAARRYVKRFDTIDRFLHFLLMVTFLGLSLTGLPLFFSTHRWAAVLANALGGFRGAGLLHRTFAAGMLACFAMHLARWLPPGRRRDWGSGPNSLVPQPRDLVQMYQNLRWFLGRGPRPRFDRYTYWEKFDYWAVFWGMAIIGGRPVLCRRPSLRSLRTVFNLVLLIHGKERGASASLIFTIHFFNSHLRPGSSRRLVIHGVVAEEELRDERPAEYARLEQSGGLATLASGPPSPRAVRRANVSAIVAVAIG